MLYRLRTKGINRKSVSFFSRQHEGDTVEGGYSERALSLRQYTSQQLFDGALELNTLDVPLDFEIFSKALIPQHDWKKYKLSEQHILDFQFGEYPVVTEKFKKLVEEFDPGIHQFPPVKVYHNDETTEIEGYKFYHFVCGRHVRITRPATIDRATKDKFVEQIYMPSDLEIGSLVKIINEPELREFLETLPIWNFRPNLAPKYISKEIKDAAQAYGLSGFIESDKKKMRDIQHVRYE